MNGLLEKILLEVLSKLATPEAFKGWEKQIVDALRALAAKSGNVFYVDLVELIATALGVA